MIRYRPFDSGDSIPAITQLLHRAYAPLAARGMKFLASHQDDAMTLERVLGGDTIVAVDDARIVGTVTVRRPGACRDAPWYERADVASVEQLAVETAWQGRGIGKALVERAEQVARSWGARELALDTSERATELIAMYTRYGYRIVDRLERDIVNYASIVLSKELV